MVGVVALTIGKAFWELDVLERGDTSAFYTALCSLTLTLIERGSYTDFPDPTLALLKASTKELPLIASVLTFLAILPLPRYALLGNSGELELAWLPALCLFFATGLVWIYWWILLGVIKVLTFVRKATASEK